MRSLITAIALLCFLYCHAQKANLGKEFQPGFVTLPDSTILRGEVKWHPHQNEKLQFRSITGETTKYSPDEILGFQADTAEFRSLFNFDVVASSFPLSGKYRMIKSSFARLLGGNRFEVYLVSITDVSPLGTGIETYVNFIFRDTKSDSTGLVPYPYYVRMKEKKIEKARERLLPVFAEFPQIVDKLKQLERGAELAFVKEVMLLR